MRRISQHYSGKLVLFLLVMALPIKVWANASMGYTVFDVVPLQQNAFIGNHGSVADVGFTISDHLGDGSGGLRLIPATGIPQQVIDDGAEFRWVLYENGAEIRSDVWDNAAQGTELIITHTFNRGTNYTLLAGYYHFDTCPGIVYQAPPCLETHVQLRWRIQPYGTTIPGFPTSGDCPFTLYEGGTVARSGADDVLPRDCTFRYLQKQSVSFATSEWRNYEGGKATNYGSRIAINGSHKTVHWTLTGTNNYIYSKTKTSTDPDGTDPAVFVLPDLSGTEMSAVQDGYTLRAEVENDYGIIGSTADITLTSFRDLRIPQTVSWTLDLSDNGGNPRTQTGLISNAGVHASETSCYFPYPTGQNVSFTLAEWGSTPQNLDPPESDYSFRFALYSKANMFSGQTGVIDLPAIDTVLSIQDFEASREWYADLGGPNYPAGNYLELGLYQVTDSRSNNMVRSGTYAIDPLEPLENLDHWRGGTFSHRLRLHAITESGDPCQTPSSLKFIDDQTNTELDTYHLSPDEPFEVTFVANWDTAQFPEDHFRGVKVSFERDGIPLTGVTVDNPWANCSTNNPIVGLNHESHLTIVDTSEVDGATMKVGLIHIDPLTNCAIEVADISGSVRLVTDGAGSDRFDGLSFINGSGETQGNLPVGKVDSQTGEADFSFDARAGGSPVFIEWLWQKEDANGSVLYWSGSGWYANNVDFSQVGSNIQGAHSRGFKWEAYTEIVQDAGKPAPFAGELDSLFGSGDGFPVTVKARVRFSTGTSAIEETTFYLQPDTVTQSRFTELLVGQGSNSSHGNALSYEMGQVDDLTFRIETNDTSDQAGFNQINVFLAVENAPNTAITPPSCDALSLHTGTISFIDRGAGNSYYEFSLTAGALRDQLAQAGIYRMGIYPEPGVCSGPLPESMRVSLTVIDPAPDPDPDPTTGVSPLVVRLHYRDQLGSSMTSKAFTAVGDITLGSMTLTLADGTAIVLPGEPKEDTWYDPFGNPLDTDAASDHQTRYTDHERDTFSGLNYMKGRYQLADAGRFNRPDPMLDWDWENPQSINLFQYVRNDPINGYDPDGFIFETGWDIGNLVLGVTSLIDNVKERNVGGALLDTGGLILDGVATLVPGVPAAAGATIKASRGLDTAADILKGADTVADTTKAADKVADAAGSVFKFGDDDLVYGPSARGALRDLQVSSGGKTLTDILVNGRGNKSWIEASVDVMENAIANGNKIHFDLTHVENLPGVLKGVGEHANSVTSQEIRYIKDNWGRISENVQFYRDGASVSAPWLQ